MATERQVPADQFAAAALEQIGDGFLSIFRLGQHAFDGVCGELASGDDARFSQRLQSLAANQDLLVKSEWNGVSIHDLVRAQLAHFADLIGQRILIEGPKLFFTPAAAQGIGLALHELATNAGKYGALTDLKGRVDIVWACDEGEFSISWTESNGPPVIPPERRGFGSTVTTSVAEMSVDGAVDLQFPQPGLTWRLTCPADKALELGALAKTTCE
jgi:two-component sensor histidine kinase